MHILVLGMCEYVASRGKRSDKDKVEPSDFKIQAVTTTVPCNWGQAGGAVLPSLQMGPPSLAGLWSHCLPAQSPLCPSAMVQRRGGSVNNV